MAIDLSVYGKVRTLGDEMRDREELAFNRRRQERELARLEQPSQGVNAPATIQIANEVQNALKSGDIERANLLMQVHKTLDRGVLPYGSQSPQPPALPQSLSNDPKSEFDQALAELSNQGQLSPVTGYNPQEMPGYAQAAGGISSKKKVMETQAQKNVELNMNPKIERETALASGRAKNIVDAEATTGKQERSASKMIDILGQAEATLPLASGSFLGAGWSAGKQLAGVSDETTKANEDLKLLSGWLTANVPRMEGPQSNFDVINYQRMAADLGNSMKPIGDRLSALQTLRSLQEKYANQNIDENVAPQPSAAPSLGQVVDGYLFTGGDPGQQSSWKKVK